MSTDWERIKQVLAEAAARNSPAERAAYLDGACRGDDGLRAEVEKLLLAHDQAGAFLEDPVAPPQHSTIVLPAPLTEKPGDRIGRYKLLQQIGEGGCGVVYMAEQEQPIRRRVALKVIKLGMDTKAVIARFEAERQALALMDHPNIAKVLDAGATDTGRPYFVMELVRGIKITDYCDQNNLSTEERLNLFVQICHAIQHAHQKGIIHRDIKPSNILVTVHDGKPLPKIIDFGIAKATPGQVLTDKTLFTAFEQFIGTPAYMSPEQAEMSTLDIDTRSDIYALGVLLYELLTGQTPFDAQELVAAGLNEMRRIIREREPVRPSTRISTLEAADQTTVAKRRHSEPPQLIHVVRGDLDWIVMKCLEKDRTRRYETANGLADDILCHLNNEPVLARPPGKLYRFQKLVRRNKLVFTAAAVVSGVLVLGTIVSTWQAVRATHAKREALTAQANEAKLRRQAQAEELAARQRAYASDMNVAKQALDGNNLGRAQELLDRQRPQPGQRDLRGWEWRYLWQQCRSDVLFTLCQESNEVDSLAVSQDGQWLAIGEFRGGLAVWDLLTRQELIRLAKDEGLVRAAFSPTEPLLAFASATSLSSGQPRFILHLWNTATRRMTSEWPLESYCMGLAFSSDGRTLLTSTSGTKGWMTLWRVADGTRLVSYAVEQPSLGQHANAFAVTPDLHLAAYGSPGGWIHIIDLHDGKELWSALGSKLRITALAFSPDQKLLASAAGYEEKDIRLWDVAVGNETKRLEGHSSFVSSLFFLPDSKRLASSSTDGTIRIWDVTNGKCMDLLRGHREPVWCLALLPDEKTLASGGRDGTVRIWDTSVTHPREPQLTIPDNVTAFRFSPDSQSIVTLDQSGRVTRWSGSEFGQREPLLEVGGILIRGFDLVWFHVFSRDGQFLAVGSSNGLMRVWDVPRHVLSCQLTNTAPIFVPVAFLDGGRKLLAGAGGSLQEWDLTTASEIQSWPANYLPTSLSPDESLCVTGVRYRDRVQVRNLAEQKTLQLDVGILQTDRSTFSPDGRRFLIASVHGYIQVLDTASWREVATLRGFFWRFRSMAFSPDGKRLVTASSGGQAVQLWDTESWQDVLTIEGQGASHNSTAVSPDGNTIGTLDATGVLQIWRAPSWAEINAAEKTTPASGP